MSLPDRPSLDELIDRVHELTPLPMIATRVMEVAEDDRFSAYDLAAVISADQALTAKLLRLSNSAYYGFPRRIATVRDAVVLLGFREVKSAAMASSLMEIAPARGEMQGPFSIDLFWGHSIASGVVAEVIARETGFTSPDEAFTGGVLHDVGQVILSQHEPSFARVVQRALGMGRKLADIEREEYGFTHAEVGRRLAERWRFPQQLVDAIGLHHDVDIVADRHGLAYVVAYANAVAHEYGLWCGYDSDTPAPSSTGLDRNDRLFQSILRRLGGYEALAQRIHSFLESATEGSNVRLHSSVMAALSIGGDDAAVRR